TQGPAAGRSRLVTPALLPCASRVGVARHRMIRPGVSAFLAISLVLFLASGGAPAQVAPLPAPGPVDAPPRQATRPAARRPCRALKPAPDPSAAVRDPVVEHRLGGWTADGVPRCNARQSGTTAAPVRVLVRSQPGLARALLTTP